MNRIILDANVLVAALTSADGASRQVLRLALLGRVQALVSLTLNQEYCDVLSRPQVLERSLLTRQEVDDLLDAFLKTTELVSVYFLWRPNLRDEADNHVFELAVAAADAPLLTFNLRDFAHAQLKFPSLSILTPAQWLQSLK